MSFTISSKKTSSNNILDVFLLLFISTSFITRVLGVVAGGGIHLILGKLTVADFFGAIAIFCFAVFRQKLLFPNVLKAYFFMLFLFSAGVIVSQKVDKTIMEIIVLCFLGILAILFISRFNTTRGLLKILITFALSSFLASFFGIWDTIADSIGVIPRIFPSRASGEALSAFRNAGQAGAYMQISLIIIAGVRYSKLYDLFSFKQKNFLNISFIISIVFFLLTGKIAAYVGVTISLLCFAIYNRSFKIFLGLSIASVLVGLLWVNLKSIAPDLYNRLNFKIQTRIIDYATAQNTGETNAQQEWMFEHFNHAFEVFQQYPLTGSGIGGFAKVFHQNEVHSTYLKMLAETGLLGTIGYIIFMSYFSIILFKHSIKPKHLRNHYSDFLAMLFPLYLGAVVSWSYTYHLRKREFFIMLAIIIIADLASKKSNFLAKKYISNKQYT